MTDHYQGKLIVFEGIDGSGKTTQARLLKEWFVQAGHPVELYHEPGGTKTGEQIRSILLAAQEYNPPMTPETEFLLFAAARRELCHQVLKPALEAGKIVILDRFAESSIAYQGYGRGLEIPFIRSVNNAVINGIKPNLTFFLHIVPETALKRLRKDKDRIENSGLKFFQRVTEGYCEIADENLDTWLELDGSQEPSSLHEQIIKRVKKLLK